MSDIWISHLKRGREATNLVGHTRRHPLIDGGHTRCRWFDGVDVASGQTPHAKRVSDAKVPRLLVFMAEVDNAAIVANMPTAAAGMTIVAIGPTMRRHEWAPIKPAAPMTP